MKNRSEWMIKYFNNIYNDDNYTDEYDIDDYERFPTDPKKEYPHGFRFGLPLPINIPTDDFGVPLHPYWRFYHYERLLDPKSLSPCFIRSRIYFPFPEPIPQKSRYFFRVMHYFWVMGIDLRQYPCDYSFEWYIMPFPSSEIVPRARDGLPESNFWLAWYFVRQVRPNFPIPAYDKNGYPVFENGFDAINDNYPEERKAILDFYYKKVEFDSQSSEIDFILNYIRRPDMDVKTYTYSEIVGKFPKLEIPFNPPTIPDMAFAYIKINGSKKSVSLDPNSFPHGFTARHRKLLLMLATPSILALLQENLPSSDPLIQDILQKFKKKLPNSPYSII
ncbi:MAG: hypothetical protein K9W44_00180 [Candidatus Lokiarchaeota archaeon]|nr:hypothetical protein [Candidatus Harpocratesius repetitus]